MERGRLGRGLCRPEDVLEHRLAAATGERSMSSTTASRLDTDLDLAAYRWADAGLRKLRSLLLLSGGTMVRLGGRRRPGAKVLCDGGQRIRELHTAAAYAAIPAWEDNARHKGLVLHHHVAAPRLIHLVTAHCPARPPWSYRTSTLFASTTSLPWSPTLVSMMGKSPPVRWYGSADPDWRPLDHEKNLDRVAMAVRGDGAHGRVGMGFGIGRDGRKQSIDRGEPHATACSM